ncbi:hypothetical protein [Psychroserpens sp.]|uniref:hypothetical protein n=1 Tax=Psychroserpens sp. TaxID=2020870 RepID=UPI0038582E23
MKREKLSPKSQLTIGVLSGLFFALIMAGFDYFNNEVFSFYKFLFYVICFGFMMALSFRYKYIKDKD